MFKKLTNKKKTHCVHQQIKNKRTQQRQGLDWGLGGKNVIRKKLRLIIILSIYCHIYREW